MSRNERPSRAGSGSGRALFAWLLRPGVVVLTCLICLGASFAARAESLGDLLRKADDLKTGNYSDFVNILQSVQRRSESLTSLQRDYLRFLEAWKNAYDGDDETAIARLNALADEPIDVSLRLRAGATAVNVLQLARRYEEAFSRLSSVLALLPKVTDKAARQQALLVAAQLYTEVGQFALALSYAQTVIEEDWEGRGVCKGNRTKQLALYYSGALKVVGSSLQSAIDSCVKVAETGNANALRIAAAMVYIDIGKFDDAIKMLHDHYDEAKASRNPRLIAHFDGLLAEAYRRKGALALARQYAWDVTNGPMREINDQLVTAYRVLYEIAKQQGDFKAALDFHEQYATADKAYLDDLSAKHLAFQKVNHENIANKLAVDALNKQNHVLQLERELTGKAVETSRLYIVLLTTIVLFVGLWAYRTKRSQLHFQTLSRLDGLTGICNRPHFIELAEKALENSRRTGAPLSLLLCDLDHFKQVNDRYGHATGDFVLKRAVSVCKPHLAKADIFGRFGGEEFAILLPGCGAEDGRQRAEQLRVAIAGITAFQTGTVKATVSGSFGISATNISGHDLGQLMAHADTALYEAKRVGRNRVVTYSQTPTNEAPALAIVSTTGEFVQVGGRSSGAS